MVRRFVLFGLSIVAIALALGGYAVAQDTATPGAEGTTVDLLCATPVSDAAGQGEQPAVVVTAQETAATPGVGLFPCDTPVAVSTPVAEAAGTAEAGIIVNVEFIDIAYVQTELTIPANTDVTLRFTNNGLTVHNFKIEDPKVFSGQLYGGDSVDLTVNLPAGTYTYSCTVPGHRAAGMVGTLTVE